MEHHKLRFHCEGSHYRADYALYVGAGSPASFTAKPLEFAAHEVGTLVGDPTLRLQPEEAQELIDTLWAAGLRPTQGKQSEGVTAAQGRHLEDMRSIAFGKLGIHAPGGN